MSTKRSEPTSTWKAQLPPDVADGRRSLRPSDLDVLPQADRVALENALAQPALDDD